uniref:receptor protein-tyrosine kinase n=2 Tax=Strongyloides stercoralis TaxID=6248 RepID=L7SX17_STRER|nr:insulin-like receptor protein tyrosine kinase isoform A [Strongyloides stercoralis]
MKLFKIIYLLSFLFIITNCHINDTICAGVSIKFVLFEKFFFTHGTYYEKIQRCTVMEGDLVLAEPTIPEHLIKFPKLREITGSLFIYGFHSINSLTNVFPKLAVIGGNSLIINYALIIHTCSNFSYIGIPSLKLIKKGGIRITNNDKICYTQTLDWTHITDGRTSNIIVEDSSKTRCPKFCKVENENVCHKKNDKIACWSKTKCQDKCDYIIDKGPGCTPNGEKCHDLCVGGCSKPGDPAYCNSCRYTMHRDICVERCPKGFYNYMNHRCVTENECMNMRPYIDIASGLNMLEEYKATDDGECTTKCPKNYEEDKGNPKKCIRCKGICLKRCISNVDIDSIASLERFKGCQIVEGNFTLKLTVGTSDISPEKLEECLGEIETINGYLQIHFTPSVISLHMFKNLREIRGDFLHNNKYALVIEYNENLQTLFPGDGKNISIRNGNVTITNNIQLCENKARAFLQTVGKYYNNSEYLNALKTNGERAICNERLLNLSFVDKNVGLPNAFLNLQWDSLNTTEMDYRKFRAYQIFYKKVKDNTTKIDIFANRSACGDSWKSIIIEDTTHSGATIKNLEPYSWYAVYMETKVMPHNTAFKARSPVIIGRTGPGRPSNVQNVIIKVSNSREMEIKWNPPAKPNGIIAYYEVSWKLIPHSLDTIEDDPCDTKAPSRRTEKYLPIQDKLLTPQSNSNNEGTCSAIQGCCKCTQERDEENIYSKQINTLSNDDKELENHEFQDKMQNLVWKQRIKREARFIRTITSNPINIDKTVPEDSFGGLIEQLDAPTNYNDGGSIRINRTSNLQYTIKNLRHFGEYYIVINVCLIGVYKAENEHDKNEQCCKNPFHTTKVTEKQLNFDKINKDSIFILNSTTEESNRVVTWNNPTNPNGLVLGYKITLRNMDAEQTPLQQCISMSSLPIDAKGERVLPFANFTGLANGRYSISIRTISLAGLSDEVIYDNIFTISVSGLFTPMKIIIVVSFIIFILTLMILAIYWYFNRSFGRKVTEAIRQTISSNPEYLSQFDVYQQDEWELKRNDVVLEEQIGSGTFGNVYKGYGNNVVAASGIKFGPCAIKTVRESASPAEKLHFLFEASVMKKFHTSFIVKLYGVVSEGQPVLVVMEMMEKGNLRDFLRTHRPNSEDNVDNKPVPSSQKLTNWAAQIADGMAYLESRKFCHRDLAARNCLVHRDETVKIGDFGMARDIYYHEYYQPTGKRLIPVRWMAQESLKDGKFSIKSDIWSYGIVLYEMLTLAQQPYAGLDNPDVFEYIVNSRRILSRPQGCADFWYNTMKNCWRYNPSDRPSFFQILMRLEPYTTEDFKQQSFVINNYERLKNEHKLDYEFDLSDDEDEEYEEEDEEIEEEEEEFEGENDSMLLDPNLSKSKTTGNHLEVINEDEKSEETVPTRFKKQVRISDNSDKEQIELLTIENSDTVA